MVVSFYQRLCFLILVGTIALVYTQWYPGSWMDRWCLEKMVAVVAPEVSLISGSGHQHRPWTLCAQSTKPHVPASMVPMVISLGDDTCGCFQATPHSPIDMAVILRNALRLGVTRPAIATVFAWDAPDPMSLAALDRILNQFESVTMCAPVTRGSVNEPLPASFRNASIPLTQVTGNHSILPRVNRIPISGIILGHEKNTYSGFQLIESEAPSTTPHLVAIWNDRLIFSFSFVQAIRRLNLPFESIQVVCGRSITLGQTGLVVPIDEYGRLKYELPVIEPIRQISVEDLIDAPEDALSAQERNHAILRDDRSAVDPRVQSFSRLLTAHSAMIQSNGYWESPRVLRRLSVWHERIFLLALAGLLCALARWSPRWTMVFYIKLGLIFTALQMLLIQCNCWLPFGSEVMALLAAAVVSFAIFIKSLTVIDVAHIVPQDDENASTPDS